MQAVVGVVSYTMLPYQTYLCNDLFQERHRSQQLCVGARLTPSSRQPKSKMLGPAALFD
jgi:hypothetical protein